MKIQAFKSVKDVLKEHVYSLFYDKLRKSDFYFRKSNLRIIFKTMLNIFKSRVIDDEVVGSLPLSFFDYGFIMRQSGISKEACEYVRILTVHMVAFIGIYFSILLIMFV